MLGKQWVYKNRVGRAAVQAEDVKERRLSLNYVYLSSWIDLFLMKKKIATQFSSHIRLEIWDCAVGESKG